MTTPPTNWKDAFLHSFLNPPGPRTLGETVKLFAKGFLMGTADIVPGVSGGTMALISGIYTALINAISSFNFSALRSLFSFKITEALSKVHLRFTLVLLLGIAVGAWLMADIMVNVLLPKYHTFTLAMFFGLIAAAVYVLIKKIDQWSISSVAALVLCGVGSWFLVMSVPLNITPSLWFIFLCGSIAICAMILPGISGAFILLVLGQYEYILNALHKPFVPENTMIIAVFIAGCLVGILLFSHVVKWLLNNHHSITMAALTGLTAGAIHKVWPWQEAAFSTSSDHTISYSNVLPTYFNFNFFITVSFMLLGFILVLLANAQASKKQSK